MDRIALDELHHRKREPIIRGHVAQGHDVGMGQACHRLHFAHEALREILISDGARVETFDSHCSL